MHFSACVSGGSGNANRRCVLGFESVMGGVWESNEYLGRTSRQDAQMENQKTTGFTRRYSNTLPIGAKVLIDEYLREHLGGLSILAGSEFVIAGGSVSGRQGHQPLPIEVGLLTDDSEVLSGSVER